MIRPVFSIVRTYDLGLGILLTLGGRNMFGWHIYGMLIHLLFWEISVGLHFKRRY